MEEEFKNLENPDEIKLLKFPECVRQRIGMYLGGNESTDNLLREIIDNSMDEANHTAENIIIDRDFNNFILIADDGRGIPILPSTEINAEGRYITQAELSISALHSGSKFTDNKTATIGQNGVGSAAVNAVSSDYILLSKITPLNWDKSIPEVKQLWEEAGPRSKRDLFYIVWYKQGYKYFEGAAKKSDIEKNIFGKKRGIQYKELPSGMSTIVMFSPDPEIFPKNAMTPDIPIQNLQYFLLIQEKFFKKKIKIYADGVLMTSSGFTGYGFEIMKRIIPEDKTMNEYVDLFISFGVDKELAPKETCGSINSLTVDTGVHINYIEDCYIKALKEEFNIKHRYLVNGLRLCVVALAAEVTFNSQSKERLKSFTKVKASDFEPITKEFQKIFRRNSEYWQEHVDRLNYLADSMKSLSASDKAQKIMDDAAGRGIYRAKADMIDGFSDATASPGERWNCELFLCFTGDTKILTCNNEKISFIDLVNRVDNGEEIYTFSCTPDGEIIPAKIIAARKIKQTNKLCIITLDNGEIIKCTPDHELMMRNGTYKKAIDLQKDDSMMPCYITVSDNYDNVNRRVILNMKPNNGKNYRPDEFSQVNGGTLTPIFHIMSKHSDTEIDDSSIGLMDNIHRHHKDYDKFNDSPRNIILCSQEKHFSYHSKDISKLAHEAAHHDPSIYQKMYVLNKRTESFKENASRGHKDFYDSDKGRIVKDNLRKAAITEWDNLDLRKWRSEETKKYSAEHEGWAKENSKKSKISYWNNIIIPAINEYVEVNNIEKTSYGFNLALINITKNTNNSNHWPDFDSLCEYIPEILDNYVKVENDSVDYIRLKMVLDNLYENNISITRKVFNETFINIFEKPLNRSKISGSHKGYDYLKNNFPELLQSYEALLNNNHKVLSVELVDVDDEDVYCLEVDTPEHNFPLAAGIFVKNCEGLSPAGSLKAARKSTKYTAVIPLRGKIKNVKDSSADQAMDNKELFTIFKLVGLGIDVNNVTSKCSTPEEAYGQIMRYSRYGKIIIATDWSKSESVGFRNIPQRIVLKAGNSC